MDLDKIPIAYATASAGMNPKHTLPLKLKAIAKAGFKWTEIAFLDLESYAESKYKGKGSGYRKLNSAGEGDLEKLLEAAKDIRQLMDQLGLSVLTVMP